MDLSNENVIHVKNKNVQYLQFKKFLEYKEKMVHCFTLKPLDFASNNTYEVNKEKVNENYKLICESLNIKNNIVRPYQEHTDNIKYVDEKDSGIFLEKFKSTDALITDKKQIALALTFADCTPIYIYDKEKNIIANIHSGWKGTLKSIAKKTVEKLINERKCNPNNIICAIGPTIRQCHFEVQKDVRDMFYEEFKHLKNIEEMIIKKEKKYYIDTVKINKQILLDVGIKTENIIDSKICTVCSKEEIYSYRSGNKERNTAIIALVK